MADLTDDADDDVELIRASRKAWGALETVHVLSYFAEEVTAALVALGLRPRLSYFAARSAAFGPVGPEVPTATFYVFAPWLHARALPSSWSVASPEEVQQARRESMAVVLHRVFGDVDDTELAELLALVRTACDGLTPQGRPLYAAHSALAWPDDPRVGLWHAAALVREHRGDGHIAVLLAAGLDPVESLVLNGLFAGNTAFLRATRGWTDEEWVAGEQRLAARGLVADGALTEAGVTFRRGLERDTDRLALEGWAHLGLEGTRRVVDLATPLRQRALDSGILPGWTSGRRT
jgi:hypothetical protein